MNKYISELYRLGQSIWCDALSREMLSSGRLERLVNEGVTGLTSNPTIFKKAIADTTSYDLEIRELSREGCAVEEICERLMVSEVQGAADVLRPVYDRTEGLDGYASLEVSPFLADDTQETVAAARRLFRALGRPNVMIKIPATTPGISAVGQLLLEGINVNITLIFSGETYGRVLEAYLTACEERLEKGERIDRLASVASFFVSRVDAICEKRFKELVRDEKIGAEKESLFLGRVGVANSKLAYSHFDRERGSKRWQELSSKGGRIQRPLWASTGTKNPDFRPTLYIEELVGSDTVNTVPLETLEHVVKGIEIESRLSQGVDEASRVVASLDSLGLPFDELLGELQEAGVKAFADSYQELLKSIESKLS